MSEHQSPLERIAKEWPNKVLEKIKEVVPNKYILDVRVTRNWEPLTDAEEVFYGSEFLKFNPSTTRKYESEVEILRRDQSYVPIKIIIGEVLGKGRSVNSGREEVQKLLLGYNFVDSSFDELRVNLGSVFVEEIGNNRYAGKVSIRERKNSSYDIIYEAPSVNAKGIDGLKLTIKIVTDGLMYNLRKYFNS